MALRMDEVAGRPVPPPRTLREEESYHDQANILNIYINLIVRGMIGRSSDTLSRERRGED